MQLKRLHFSSPIEIVSSVSAILIILLYPSYIYWMMVAKVKPTGQFITVKSTRNLFESFKVKNKNYAVVDPLRKLLMTVILVLFQSYPKF